MVGLLAEAPPAGFGFSDTAFRIFLLMASRRLQSDRFLTVDFHREGYTPLGMDWIKSRQLQHRAPATLPLSSAMWVAGGKAVFAPSA